MMKLAVRNLVFRRQLFFVLILFVFFLAAASALLPARARVEVEAAAPSSGTRFHMASDSHKQAAQQPAAKKADAVKEACTTCHTNAKDPQPDGQVPSCVACQGGNPTATDKATAHIKPKYPKSWPTSANPEESFIQINKESREFIRFENPSDLRVANDACGKCHDDLIKSVKKYAMTTSAQVYS